jgi:hypothetical protein
MENTVKYGLFSYNQRGREQKEQKEKNGIK